MQGQLALESVNRPDFDCLVIASTGQLSAVGAPCQTCDPECEQGVLKSRNKQTKGMSSFKREKESTYKFECPVSVDMHSLVETCQNLMFLSQEPLTMRLGIVGENATLDTL